MKVFVLTSQPIFSVKGERREQSTIVSGVFNTYDEAVASANHLCEYNEYESVSKSDFEGNLAIAYECIDGRKNYDYFVRLEIVERELGEVVNEL